MLNVCLQDWNSIIYSANPEKKIVKDDDDFLSQISRKYPFTDAVF